MNKKIVFYDMTMRNGGAERVIASLANNLVSKNYDIYVMSNIFEESFYKLDGKIHYITIDNTRIKNRIDHLYRKISPKRTNVLRKKLDEIQPDLVVSFLPEPSLRSLTKKKYKTILSERCDPNREYSNIILKLKMKRLYKKADGFVFQTNDAKEYYKDIINCKSTIIPNPVNDKFIGKTYQGEKEKTIVNVGRFFNQKNQLLLLDAFEKFSQTHGDYILKLYGDGPLKEKLKEYATDKRIIDKIKFMGVVDDLPNRLIYDKMFVLSSDYEGMPNSLIEAMSLGMPCISTDCPVGGPKFLIKNYENGILVPTNNAEALARAMTELADNIDLCNKLSKNAQKLGEELNSQAITKKWEDFFVSVLESEDFHTDR